MAAVIREPRIIPVSREHPQHDALQLAYKRPCYVCRRTGNCQHRESRVELAILEAKVSR